MALGKALGWVPGASKGGWWPSVDRGWEEGLSRWTSAQTPVPQRWRNQGRPLGPDLHGTDLKMEALAAWDNTQDPRALGWSRKSWSKHREEGGRR